MTYKSIKRQITRIFNSSTKLFGTKEPDPEFGFNFQISCGYRSKGSIKGKSAIRILNNPEIQRALNHANCEIYDGIADKIKEIGVNKRYNFLIFITENENNKITIEGVTERK